MNKIGIIGYGSMGRMLLEKFSEAGKVNCDELFISNRTISKIAEAPEKYTVCRKKTSYGYKTYGAWFSNEPE